MANTHNTQDYAPISQPLNHKIQRRLILEYLKDGEPLSTIFLREHLNIQSPSARISELRKTHPIKTKMGFEYDAFKRRQKVAFYSLVENSAD